MISYKEFTNFKETNYNFSVCDDWGWFHVDEEDPFLQNAIISLHHAMPLPQRQPIKSSLKPTPPVANPFIKTLPNVIQKMPHARLIIDNVYTPVSHIKNNWDPASSFNAIKNGLVLGVVIMIYILSP